MQNSNVQDRYAGLQLEVQLCFPLYATSRAVTARYAELLGPVGLTYPQYLVMLTLWEGTTTVGEIGTRLRLDSGTLTPLVKRLEGRGLVTRHRDPADERRVLVEPTAAGWGLREEVVDVPREIAMAMGLTVEDYHELRRLLGKLVDNVRRTKR